MLKFLKDESGAVTVDWVVLTAATVGLGLATLGIVQGGVQNLSTDVSGQMQAEGLIRTTFAAPAFAGSVNYSGLGGGLGCQNPGGVDYSVSLASQGCVLQNVSQNITFYGEDGNNYQINQVDYYNTDNERTRVDFRYRQNEDGSGWEWVEQDDLPESVQAYVDPDRLIDVDSKFPNGWQQ